MDTKAQTVATYNATAAEMAKKFRDIGARIDDIERALALFGRSESRVFEIGYGDGRDAREILKRTPHYHGIDISEGMTREARAYVPEGNFEVADAETCVFPADTDIILSFASLLHSPRDAVGGILARAQDSLSASGIFYISLKMGEYEAVTKTDAFGTRTYYMYTPQLIEELAGAGFRTAYLNEQEMRGQRWFTIALRKI